MAKRKLTERLMGSQRWWETDEVNLIAAFLDGRSLAVFTCCRVIRSNLRSRDTLRWLAELRGLDHKSIASIEHIELAEAMANLSSSIFFRWGSLEIDECAFPSLQKIAKMLARHTSLSLSIEAHCGLELQVNVPIPGLPREYTRRRANAVRTALLEQAVAAEVMLDPSRVVTKAWGCSRPLVWAFVDKAYDPSGIYVDEEASARNRRVELYLRSGGFEVPQRRRRSEIPVEPGKLPLEDGSSDGENSEEDDTSKELQKMIFLQVIE